VEYGGSYTLKFVLDPSCSESTPKVKVNGTAVNLISGEYTISNITAKQTVTVEDVIKNTYSVALTPGTGYTLSAKPDSASPTDYGSDYSFTLVLDPAYSDSNPTVKANGKTILPVGEEYTVDNITADQTVTVEDITKNSYGVILTTGTGYTLAAKSGSSSPVEHGNNYTFILTLDSDYSGSKPVVKVNGTAVALISGEYTISNITEVKTVTVENVIRNGGGFVHIIGATPKIIEGANGKWTFGSTAWLAFKSSAGYSTHLRVEVDGKTVPRDMYDILSGSTIIKLKPEFLEMLSVGIHTLGVVSTTGTASTTFEILESFTEENPNTGFEDVSLFAVFQSKFFCA
jgi:hypothetical protein